MKIYYMGKRIRDNEGRFTSLKIKVKNFVRQVVKFSLFAGFVYVAFIAGRYIAPEEQIVNVVQAIEEKGLPPVLERIGNCESGNKHYGENGQVILRGNENKTVDIGRFQINNYYWGKQATELGYNLFEEEDNEKMALWLYENKGTEPWVHTKSCWNK